jgi:tRNA threonylcarbamoyl adenosine modification protein (Sua5/YciO/YrdC/YwlC family)
MIEKIVPSNIDNRVINRAAALLEDGALVALPTDTSWSIVCSIKAPAGIKKLRELSGERDERHFTLLCSSISQFSEMCNLNNNRFRTINRLSPGPYVFILKTLKGTEKTLDIRRHEVGVRIPNYPIPIRLIETLGHPLFSITAKKSMTAWGGPESFGDEQADTELPPIPEEQLFENAHELADIEELALILDSGEDRERIFSTILDMCQDEINLLRMGAGHWPV